MHHGFINAIAYLSFAMCFCSIANGESHAADKRMIRELDAAWSQSLENKDLDKAMSNYAEDASFLPPDASIVRGKEKIRERFANRMRAPGYSASFVPTKIVISKSGDMAYEVGTFRVMISGEHGEPIVRLGKHLVVWGKRGGQWKVLAESINYD